MKKSLKTTPPSHVIVLCDYDPYDNGNIQIPEKQKCVTPDTSVQLKLMRGEKLKVVSKKLEWWVLCRSLKSDAEGYVPTLVLAPIIYDESAQEGFLFFGVPEFGANTAVSNHIRLNGEKIEGEKAKFIPCINQSLKYFPNAPVCHAKKPCPKSNANIFSLITFWWMNKLIVNGFKRSLVEEDVWSLQEEYTASFIVTRAEKEWKKEMEASKRSPIIKKRGKNNNKVEEPLVSNKGKDLACNAEYLHTEEHKYQPSLTKIIIHVMGPYYFVGYIFKIIHDIFMFVNPYLLGKLINFVQNKNEDIYWGYTYAIVLLVVVTVQSICLQQYFQRTTETCMKVRTAVMGLVYKKMFSLSSKGRQNFTAGEMVNIMSVDAQICHDVVLFAVWFWSAPFQIAVSLGFLYIIMGWSIFLGVLILVLLVPVGVFLSKKEKKFHAKQMIQKDLRSKLVNEILNGVKILKLYAWEDSFAQKVMGYRNKELTELKKSKFLQAKVTITNQCAPFVVSVVIFASYVYVAGGELTAEKAFVSISIINIMRFPIHFIPRLIQLLVQYKVSEKRITDFLKADELNENDVQKLEYNKQETAIKMDNGEFTWNEEKSVLKDINLSIPQGSLTAIVGQVGTGKSSLISAILGEMPKIQGTVTTCGKTGYVAQQAWIQNQTLRENILFEKSYRKEKYNKIVDACAMAADLEVLPVGDMTEIGERGINLSGGQKQRVSLARAVYSNADIYLLDDPLSAVDAHVGKHIFDCVIGSNGLLKNKTRILVTHNLTFLPYVDQIIVLKNNTISERGSYKELLENGNDFAEFLKTYHKQSEGTQSDDVTLMDNPTNQDLISSDLQGPRGSIDVVPHVEFLGCSRSVDGVNFETEEDRLMSASTYSLFDHVDCPPEEEIEIQQLLHDHEDYEKKQANSAGVTYQEEKSEIGTVNYKVFLHYFQLMGIIFTMLIFLFGLMQEALLVASRFWLAEWSTHVNITDTERDRYISIYGGMGIVQSILVLFMMYSVAVGSIGASRRLHNLLLTTILKCPMSFFETTPMGRIVNRFVKDINIIDDSFPKSFQYFIDTFMTLLGTIFVISYSTPLFLAVFFPIAAFYIFTQRFYVASSRQLKRIESVNRSPIYNHYFESIGGASTIRAFDKCETFINGNEMRIDKNQAAHFPAVSSNRWLAMRLEFCGNLITFFAALFTIVNSENLSAGIAGLAISYAMQITQSLNWLVRMTSDLETNIISVERVKNYIDTPKEAPSEIPEHRPDESWPEHGIVKFDMYSVRYRDDLDLVLKNIDCSIEAGEKMGIVGRTGAGKSSMMLSLFRIIESASGKILIDGVDIASIGLKDLRSKLSIIPQDPVLFSSSFRFNLDPFDKFSDEEIWRALEVSHLKDFVSSLSGGLFYEIVEGGSNLSVGQRQLVCLARALLRRSKILVLDEATAAVDMETDAYIQEAIRNEFSKCTVLTIAHRLNTIMDYDRIMVLDKGHVVELDTPKNLLSDSQSIFFGMAKEAGLLNETNNCENDFKSF